MDLSLTRGSWDADSWNESPIISQLEGKHSGLEIAVEFKDSVTQVCRFCSHGRYLDILN
jgi:hypothetical protein